MAIIPTLGEVLRALGSEARYSGDTRLLSRRPAAVSTDSRTCGAGALFVALRGEKFDGHDFAAQVLSHGALAAVVESRWFAQAASPAGDFLAVPDSLQALQRLGSAVRRRWGQTLFAITGSNGKTTTKEMVAVVLAQKLHTHKNTGNLNNHLGVPLTLAALAPAHEVAVVEMGTNHFGEIAALCELAVPNLGLITNIGRAHTEFFGNLAGVARAKGELLQYLQQHDGIAFLNVDDPLLRATLPPGLRVVTYGLESAAQIQGRVAGLDDQGCVRLRWRDLTVRLNVPGLHHAGNALAAIAVGDFFGVAPAQIKEALEGLTPPAKRMQVTTVAGMTIINDAYNANPESLRAALQFLASRPVPAGSRRLAILGDMLELGEGAEPAHREIGELIATLPIQAVFAFGPHMKHLVQAVGRRCWAEHFDDKDDLVAEVARAARAGDILLVKGSRSMAMEEVISRLAGTAHEGKH